VNLSCLHPSRTPGRRGKGKGERKRSSAVISGLRNLQLLISLDFWPACGKEERKKKMAVAMAKCDGITSYHSIPYIQRPRFEKKRERGGGKREKRDIQSGPPRIQSNTRTQESKREGKGKKKNEREVKPISDPHPSSSVSKQR